MEPDYKSYSLDELYDVKENIDADLYPERFQSLAKEIKSRESKIDIPVETGTNEENNSEGSVILRILAGITALYFGWCVINAFVSGSISGRSGYEYFADSQPTMFGIWVIIHCVFFFLITWWIFNKSSSKRST